MKMLHVITGLSTGGAERALYNVLAGGLAQRYDAAVLSLQDEGTVGAWIRRLGVQVHTLHMRRGFPTPHALMQLRRVVGRLQPDILQGWMYHGNLAASISAHLMSDTPAVAWNVRQSLYDLASEKPLTRQVIRASRAMSGSAQAIIYNSRLSRSQHETLGFASARATVIPNGFDLERLRTDRAARATVRAELRLPEDARVVGHVARFHPMKDHASFLRAAVRVAQEDPRARFLLVGRGVSLDNPALANIVPPGLVERFLFTGERSEPQRLMQAMDALATSSAWGEAFPNVLGEAMACGVPCVTTDVGDSADIVGNTGIVVSPSDSEALAAGLKAMLGKSDAGRRKLGEAARARVETNFSLQSVVTRYVDLYEELANRRHS